MRYRNLFLYSAFILLLSCNLAAAQALLKTWVGKSTEGTMGQSLGKIGDVDGDQVEDLVIGEPGSNSSPGGRVYVVSGKAGSVLHEIWCFPPCTSGRFGYSVSGLGDVNQDGVGDFVVGSFPGEVRVYSGATGSVLLQISGAQLSMGGLGISVSGIGDSNQDGVADILLGSESGEARLVSGADASVIYSWSDPSTTHQFGARVASAGDVDGDGVRDILVGAPGVAAGQATQNGYVKVFSGANGQLIYTVNPVFPYSSAFGSAIAGIGDVNADGSDDFIVGSYTSGSSLLAGDVSVYSGQDASLLYFYSGTPVAMYGTAVAGVGDVNGDATPDFAFSGSNLVGVKVYSGADGSQIFSLIGADSTDTFGASLLGAGDTNGDGIEDLVIGITHLPQPFAGPALGRVELYAGSAAVFKNYGTSSFAGLSIHGKGVPAIGATVSVDVNPPASAQGLLVVGSQAANLPWNGGTLLVDPLYVFPHTTSGPFSTLISIPFQIPQDPSLLGSHFYFQGVYATAPAGIVSMTDGLEMSVQ